MPTMPGTATWAELASSGATPDSLAAIATADSAELSGADLVDAINATEKALSLLTGIQMRFMSALAEPFTAGDPMRLAGRIARKNMMNGDASPEQVEQCVPEAATCLAASEIAAALRISPITAGNRVREAATMTTALAPTLKAMEAGLIDRGKSRVIAEQCHPLTPGHIADVQNIVLPEAGHLTTSELRDLAAHTVITIDPEGAEERHQAAAIRRDLLLRAQPDAMATLSAFLPADGAVKIFQISDLLATSTAGTPDDNRGIGARRIDALVDIADHLLTYGHLDLSHYIDHDLPDHGSVQRKDRFASTTSANSDVAGEGNADTICESSTLESSAVPSTDLGRTTGPHPDESPSPSTRDHSAVCDPAPTTSEHTDRRGSTASSAAPSAETDDPNLDAIGAAVRAGETTGDAVNSSATSGGFGPTPDPAAGAAAVTGGTPPRVDGADADPTSEAEAVTGGTPSSVVGADADPAGQAAAPIGADTSELRVSPRPSDGTAIPATTNRDFIPHRTPPRPVDASPHTVSGRPDLDAGNDPGYSAALIDEIGSAYRAMVDHLDGAAPSDRERRSRRIMTRQGRRPHLSVTINVDTLAGINDLPAHLAGFGAIPASLGRAIAHSAETVTALITDATGVATEAGQLTYRPTQRLRDQISALTNTCQFPSCRQPVWRCDLDHREPFDHAHPEHGGATDADNIGPFCRRHHLLKHHTEWRFRPDPENFTLHWTSPTGHNYSSKSRVALLPTLAVTTPQTALAERLDHIAGLAPAGTTLSPVEEFLTTLLLHRRQPPTEYDCPADTWEQLTHQASIDTASEDLDDLADGDGDEKSDSDLPEEPPF